MRRLDHRSRPERSAPHRRTLAPLQSLRATGHEVIVVGLRQHGCNPRALPRRSLTEPSSHPPGERVR
jgi:hypothetical protein